MQRRFRWLIIGLALVAAGLFVAREVRDEINKRRALPVVSELGGRILSLPFWPFGNEYVIVFRGSRLTMDELRRLTVLNPLTERHTISIMFDDTNLTHEDIQELRQLLPKCNIFRAHKGERLNDR